MLRRMMMAGLKHQAPAAGGNQTVNIKFDTAQVVIAGWNVWVQGINNGAFLNTAGSSSGVQLLDVSGYFYDVEYSASKNDAHFPDQVINRLCYTDIGDSKSMKLTGLNNNSRYDLLFCSFASDANNIDNTDFIVQGLTKFSAVDDPDIVFKTSFQGVAPVAGEISITIQGSPADQKYGCFNALILTQIAN